MLLALPRGVSNRPPLRAVALRVGDKAPSSRDDERATTWRGDVRDAGNGDDIGLTTEPLGLKISGALSTEVSDDRDRERRGLRLVPLLPRPLLAPPLLIGTPSAASRIERLLAPLPAEDDDSKLSSSVPAPSSSSSVHHAVVSLPPWDESAVEVISVRLQSSRPQGLRLLVLFFFFVVAVVALSFSFSFSCFDFDFGCCADESCDARKPSGFGADRARPEAPRRGDTSALVVRLCLPVA